MADPPRPVTHARQAVTRAAQHARETESVSRQPVAGHARQPATRRLPEETGARPHGPAMSRGWVGPGEAGAGEGLSDERSACVGPRGIGLRQELRCEVWV